LKGQLIDITFTKPGRLRKGVSKHGSPAQIEKTPTPQSPFFPTFTTQHTRNTMSEDHKRQLEQQLWNIANTLRGKMNADEFRDYT
jgi:hypothetical protein